MIPLVADTESLVLGLVTAITGTITTLFGAWITYLTFRLKAKATVLEDKVGAVESLAAETATTATKAAASQSEKLKTIERQTNGLNDTLRAERDEARRMNAELQAKYEAALKALPPGTP